MAITSDPCLPDTPKLRAQARPPSGNHSPALLAVHHNRRFANRPSHSNLLSLSTARRRVITRSQSVDFSTHQPQAIGATRVLQKPSVMWAAAPSTIRLEAPDIPATRLEALNSPPLLPPTAYQVGPAASTLFLTPCSPPWQTEFHRSPSPTILSTLDKIAPPSHPVAHRRTLSDIGSLPPTSLVAAAPTTSSQFKPENGVDPWPAPATPHIAACTLTLMPPLHPLMPRLDQLYPPFKPSQDAIPSRVESDAYASHQQSTCAPAEVEMPHRRSRARLREAYSDVPYVALKNANGKKPPPNAATPISTRRAQPPLFFPLTPETAHHPARPGDEIRLRDQLPSPPPTTRRIEKREQRDYAASFDSPFIDRGLEGREKTGQVLRKSGSMMEFPESVQVVRAAKSQTLRAISPGMWDMPEGTREQTPTPTLSQPMTVTLGRQFDGDFPQVAAPRDRTKEEAEAGLSKKGKKSLRGPKTTEVCDTCRANHRKCDGQIPCRVCIKKRYRFCLYSGTATHPRDEPLVASAGGTRV
ncbi:hypothetical protein L202_00642 [Cryptococcus amylolentus CBS 6039]|uniref:Zn(2)-C6 fungal-type domain-containing protein n=1 Tax=Cryptococcus amylolentus CBS 6039 TaxID=1295533 RepID=A0A1E3I868_9TREE|nr:hypothetical protein L202_00642 [Cryptococcus amylolentus CBS 6039]ODN84767.1 hypothetical protein L202_00642 [Cryptococcus amylolentus CBS 6039]